MDDDSYKKREAASAALQELGAAAEPALRATREKSTSLEVCARIDALLEHLQGGRAESEAERRQRRLVEVLELIGTEQARAGLSDILAHWIMGRPGSPRRASSVWMGKPRSPRRLTYRRVCPS